MDWLTRWHVTMTAADALLGLSLNLLAALLAFLAGVYFLRLRFLIGERRHFRKLFGTGTIRDGYLTITLDVYQDIRLLDPQLQRQLGVQNPSNPEDRGIRFVKQFPDHITTFPGAWEHVLGFCSARSAMYLADAFGRFLSAGVRITSDVAVVGKWEGTFINIGSSYSNVKTDQVKKLPENQWLKDDEGRFTLRSGEHLEFSEQRDVGIILRIRNPRSKRSTLFVCAGLGEWGSSGAARYLANHWKSITRRYGRRDFAIYVAVQHGSDESASEIRAFSDPSWWDRFLASVRKPKQRHS